MRSVILTSLLPLNGESLEEELKLAEDLSSEIIPSQLAIEKTRKLLRQKFGRPPRVLDIFGGGGTIAIEAGRIGCEAHTIDINPLAHFIQKSLLEFSQTRSDLPELTEKYGKKMLDKLKIETEQIYRRGSSGNPFEKHIAFLWSRSVQCSNPSCEKTISLSGDWWVSKKASKKVLLAELPDKESGKYWRQLICNPILEDAGEKWTPAKGLVCPFCGKTYSKREFQSLILSQGLDDQLLCVRVAYGTSKCYELPEPLENFYPSKEELSQHIRQDLEEIGQELPDCKVPHWSGIVNPSLYGAQTYADLFNQRQLSTLLKVIKALRELTRELLESGFSKTETVSIVSMLSGFVDQLVDWNCRLSMWIEENEQVGRAVSGPGIPMLWRYSEIDPFLEGPSNLYDKLNRMINALEFIPKFPSPAHAYLASATKLPFDSGLFDAIITDPAYGDNLFYSALSQCIYGWKRMVFRDLIPEIFSKSCVPLEEEIVAPIYRLQFKDAMSFYEKGLTDALREACRVLSLDGIISLFFCPQYRRSLGTYH